MAITTAGGGYINASEVVSAAEKAGLSVCDYLEGRERDRRKVGRRSRIIQQMVQHGLLGSAEAILEIGAGTGMYLEAVLARSSPKRYEVYETDIGWRRFLEKKYGGPGTCLKVQAADGISFSATSDSSVDLIHAHGVFVYTPALTTFRYLEEVSRVCRPGGMLIFDCYLDSSFGLSSVGRWLETDWLFPVILPKGLLLAFCESRGLCLENQFSEIHGASEVDYLVFRKMPVS